jgi:hypothetical protein
MLCCFYILGPWTKVVNGKITLIGVTTLLFSGACSTHLPTGFSPVASVLDWIRANSDVDNWPCNNH